MEQERSRLREIIEVLRRQQVRQGDFDGVVACVLAQASLLEEQWPAGPLSVIALHMKARALEIQRCRNSVPKFVVEDLLDEAIARLEQEAARR